MEGERRSEGFRRSGGFGNRSGGFGNRGGGFNRRPRRFNDGPREMHKATCSDCGKECEVPFEPTQGKPVYCKECYFKRKDSGNMQPRMSAPVKNTEAPTEEVKESVQESEESEEMQDEVA